MLPETYDKLADISFVLNMICGLGTLAGPILAFSLAGRKAAARTAGILTLATVATGLADLVFLKLAALADTGFSLLLVIPLTMLAILSGIVWLIVGTRPQKE